jgi:hypothetical protein
MRLKGVYRQDATLATAPSASENAKKEKGKTLRPARLFLSIEKVPI